MLQQFAKHHNKIQFFGYEVANILLIVHQFWRADEVGYGFNAETLTALTFLLGSAFIWRFDPQRRPHLLFYGGLALAAGGVFLTVAGYIWTGLAVVLASLETARGGRTVLNGWVVEQRSLLGRVSLALAIHNKISVWSIAWYCLIVELLVRTFPTLGRFINERPFITSTAIKAPLRLDFIIKKLLMGDWLGTAVGLSWLLLGDLALAMNDTQLRQRVMQRKAVHPQVHFSFDERVVVNK